MKEFIMVRGQEGERIFKASEFWIENSEYEKDLQEYQFYHIMSRHDKMIRRVATYNNLDDAVARLNDVQDFWVMGIENEVYEFGLPIRNPRVDPYKEKRDAFVKSCQDHWTIPKKEI